MQFVVNNWYLFLAAAIIIALLVGAPIRARLSGVVSVRPHEAVRIVNRENAVLVDVREAAEYEAGHIPNAVHIPLGEIATARTLPGVNFQPRQFGGRAGPTGNQVNMQVGYAMSNNGDVHALSSQTLERSAQPPNPLADGSGLRVGQVGESGSVPARSHHEIPEEDILSGWWPRRQVERDHILGRDKMVSRKRDVKALLPAN